MKNIVLMCAGGMSTSIIMKNIKKAADAEGLECEVSAHAVNEAATIGRNADCNLLRPQVGYAKDEVCAACPEVPGRLNTITTYRMIDGVKALAQAKELMRL